MDGFIGMLAVAGGFGLALGLTMLGMTTVLALMPNKQSREESRTR